jgi:hypothetical protein
MRTTWCEDAPDLLFPNAVDVEPARAAYHSPTLVAERGEDVFARKLGTHELYRYSRGEWSRVAGPTRAMVEVGGEVFRLSADGTTIEAVDLPDGGSLVIGGPASHILRCTGHLCALSIPDGSLLRYVSGSWQRISGRARQFASTDTRLARIPLDGQGVELYDEATEAWLPSRTDLTVLAGWLVSGAGFLLATNPRQGPDTRLPGTIYVLPNGSNTWTADANSGRYHVALVDGTVAGMSPGGEAIYLRPPGHTGNWPLIALGWVYRIDGRSTLYAEDGWGALHAYRQGEWTDHLGLP